MFKVTKNLFFFFLNLWINNFLYCGLGKCLNEFCFNWFLGVDWRFPNRETKKWTIIRLCGLRGMWIDLVLTLYLSIPSIYNSVGYLRSYLLYISIDAFVVICLVGSKFGGTIVIKCYFQVKRLVVVTCYSIFLREKLLTNFFQDAFTSW